MDFNRGAIHQEADVAGDAYTARSRQGDHSYLHQQHPALSIGGFPTGFGAGGSQCFPSRSVPLYRDTAQAPIAPSLKHSATAALYTPASFAAAAPQAQQQYRIAPAADASRELANDALKSVRDLPAVFQSLYSFRYLNAVQSECFDVAYKTDTNMVISAPTGAGKTGVMELAILRLLSKHLSPGSHGDGPQQQRLALLQGRHKVVYIGPIKALVQERHNDWRARYGTNLGLRCVQLTGDVDDDQLDDELDAADIICTTPEKFDQVTRKVKELGKMAFFAQLGLVLLDEVHLLNEAGRGSSLESGCVGRIKAVARVPEMVEAQVASVRFVAVSATIPNIHDLAAWLNVPAAGIKQYGDELRPCKLTTHVKGYNAAKNDFLFERRLNEYVYGITTGYSNGRPALVFCNSRKGTTDTATILAKAAASQASSTTGSVLVKTISQLQRLQAAAAHAKAKGLASVLVAGVGFHHAAMEPEDRDLVESLFKSNDLPILCTTSTLAMGVNLPAHLVVIKGTTRYVGDSETAPGEATGYKEYSQTEVLQMVGRAGRPQFDNEGVAVIMTSKDSIHRYQRMVTGQPVESCLMANLAEHLNAELVLGTIQDVPGAIQWIKSSFLYTRVCSNPQHYGLANKLKPGMSQAEVDSVLKSQLIMQPVSQLLEYKLVTTDEDTYSLSATKAGKLMASHFLKLRTMAAIVKLGERPNMQSLLRVICGAEEFKNMSLRRCEKKMLNEMNHSSDPQQLRYHVMAMREDGTATGKVKERLSSPQEKLFVLLNDALADKPCEALDYSLKQEQERLLLIGQRIAKCMARYYIERNSFSAAGRSLLLARSLRAKLWDDSQASVRQVHGVGKLLAARLSSAGLGSLKALIACNDAHQIEVAAQKPYPWGAELLANLRSMIPPAVTMQLQVLSTLPNRALNCQLTLTRTEDTAGLTAATATDAARNPQTSICKWAVPAHNAMPALAQEAPMQDAVLSNRICQTHTPCKLLCGCSNTDQLLLLRSVVLESFASPLQVAFRVEPPADSSQPINIAARLVLDRFVGLDEKASIVVDPPAALAHHRQQQQQHVSLVTSRKATQKSGVAEPIVEGDAAGGPAGSAPDEMCDSRPKAVVSVPAKQRNKRRLVGAVADGGQAKQEELIEPAVAAAAKQRCGSQRQRSTAHSTQILRERQAPQQQQDHNRSSATPTGSFCVAGLNAPEQLLAAPKYDKDQSAVAGTATADIGPAATAADTVPKTAIAARYKRLLLPAAASAEPPEVQQPPADVRAKAACSAERASSAEASTAALDAGKLQVTPEHQRQLQQSASQQQIYGPQQDNEQQMLQAVDCQQWTGHVVQQCDKEQATPESVAVACVDDHLPGHPAQQLVKQQASDAVPPLLDFDADHSISALFDMLADGVDDHLEQQHLPKMSAGHQHHIAAPSCEGHVRSSVQTAAAAADARKTETHKQCALPPCERFSSTESVAAYGSFGAAVLRSRTEGCKTEIGSQRTLVSADSAATHPTISSQLTYQRTGLRSQLIGLGAQRLGSAGSSAGKSSRAATTSRTADPGLEEVVPLTWPATRKMTFPHNPRQISETQQQQQRQQRRQLQHEWGHTVSPVRAGLQQQPTGASAVATAGFAEFTGATGAHGVGAHDLMTPPRQIVRSGPSSSLFPSVGRGGRVPHHLDLQPQQNGVDVQVLQIDHGMEHDDVDGSTESRGPPDLQQFAYEPGARPPPTAAAYKPSHNVNMFHRPKASATAPAAINRALTQVKLAGRSRSHASGSGNSSGLTMHRLQQQNVFKGESLRPRAATGNLGTMGMHNHQGTDHQHQQQHGISASYLHPLPAATMQWKGFVDQAQQQERLETTKQARATWRPAALEPAARYSGGYSGDTYHGGMPKGALGVGGVKPAHSTSQQQQDLPGSRHAFAPASPSLSFYQRQLPAAACMGGDLEQVSSAAAESAAEPITAHATVMDYPDARAEEEEEDIDGGCVDFGGIFDFMQS